jgi:hypothetical protein
VDIEQTDFLKRSVLVSMISVVAGIFIYFFSFLNSSYSPYYGDEFFYFKNAENFTAHSSLKAAFSYSGEGSLLFGIDPHGPAYPLLYGFVSKVIGWFNLNIPMINTSIFLISLSFLILCSKNYQSNNTLLQVLLVLGSPITLFYSITFLPEVIHLAGGIFLFIASRKYLNSKSNFDFYTLVSLILILGFSRNTWFFALIGILFLPNPLNNYKKSMLVFLGILLPFLFQHFLHEQVPNTFSGLIDLIEENKLKDAIQTVLFNFKRNIFFAFTYTEGWFYTLQKLWLAGTLITALYLFRENKLVLFGFITLVILIFFNLVLYKNYTWVDLRLYTPMLFFLNLEFLSNYKVKRASYILLVFNLSSFAFIIPLQKTMTNFRLNPDVNEIPKEIITTLKELKTNLILIDSTILHDYALYQLPISNSNKEPIRYILPYYPIPIKDVNYVLRVEKNQLSVSPRNILSQ